MASAPQAGKGVEPAKVWGASFLGAAEWFPSVPRVTGRCLFPFLSLVGSGRDFCVPGTSDEFSPLSLKNNPMRELLLLPVYR